MKITSLEIIFWFPLKSFSSLKCILLSVLTAFLLCFKDNHKGYVASTYFSSGNFLILCNKKLLYSSDLRLVPASSEHGAGWQLFSFTSFDSPIVWICVFPECGSPNFIFILHMLLQTGEMFMNNARLFSYLCCIRRKLSRVIFSEWSTPFGRWGQSDKNTPMASAEVLC